MILARVLAFAAAGAFSFFLGLSSSYEVRPIGGTEAQQPQTTTLNIVLQYQPAVGGGTPEPIVVTSTMNPSQSALVYLQEIHTGDVVPVTPSDRCRTTLPTGRCAITNVPVGGTPAAQYDILVDTVFIEFLTAIALTTDGAIVRFDQSLCSGSTTSFTGPSWCLTKPGGNFATEYFVTVTLEERNDCTDTVPPAAFCDSDPRRIVHFACNPSTADPNRPFERDPEVCGPVQCPDGNTVDGLCDELPTGLAACSTAASCVDHQLCTVLNFGMNISYRAGEDTIIIRGERFGILGGTISFPVEGGRREIVTVSPGPDWTDTEIRVRVPQAAISGTLEIHPATHGFFTQGQSLIPAVCVSPPANIRAFRDQFSILSINAMSSAGVQLVSPGFDTTFTLLVEHHENFSRFASIVVELVQGAFPDPQNLPIERTLITQVECPIRILGSPLVREATLECAVPIPESAGAFAGPFTFIVTLADGSGEIERAVLLATDESALIGDFNFDGRLSIEDAAIGFRIARGVQPVLLEHLTRDTNDDNTISFPDALFVLHSLTE